MAKKPKILAFAGSLRKNSYTKRVLKTAVEGAKKAGADVTYIDLKDYPLPIYDADDHAANGFPENALKLQRLLGESDGFLIASPEYNGSVSGGLKNMIDWASRKSDEFGMIEVFKGKTAAIMTASPGAFGGIRCLAHLRGILTIMLVNVLPSEIAVAKVGSMFEGDAEEMTDEKMKTILEELGASLVVTLKRMRGDFEVVEEAGK